MMRAGREWMLGVAVVANVVSALPNFNTQGGRLCVEEGVNCSKLIQDSGGSLVCTPVRDRLDCLKKIRDNEADFGYFEAEDLNIAAVSFKDDYDVVIQVLNERNVQRVYLLVHNASNFNPTSVCHPGLDPHYYYPIINSSHQVSLTKENRLKSMNENWSSGCIPGQWSQDPITDIQLKKKYPKLCQSCLGQTCQDNPYAGPGALQCLLDQAADAAFVYDVDLKRSRSKNPEVEKLYQYCRHGSGKSLVQPLSLVERTGSEEEACSWGTRPLPVILFSSNTTNSTIRQTWIKGLTSHANIVYEVLKLPEDSQMKVLENFEKASEIIKKAGFNPSSTFNKPIKFCVQNDDELKKCQDAVVAAQGYGADEGVGLGCFLNQNFSHCYPYLFHGKADVITLDGGDVHHVVKDYGFKRLLSEEYKIKAGTPTSSYYAVAVVRADSNITSFAQLQGRKSCHTGIGKTAGWKLPVAALLQQGLISAQHCNYVRALAEFFTGGSCAPGAKLPLYNPQSNYVSRLCSLCVGEGENQCARNSDEPFYSYTGAFRCLVHGGGDVAFVKHTTVGDNTDGNNPDSWAVGLRSEDYRLLCPPNSRSSTAAISEYHTCNHALVPAHEVVVAGETSKIREQQIRQVLLQVAEVFKGSSPGSKTFRLFGSYKGKSDLLFKDSAIGLRALSEDSLEERNRKQDYYNKLDELHSCEVRVCALEGQESDCDAMANVMSGMGQKFVCVTVRDRLDCVKKVLKGMVEMSPLPGNYLDFNPALRIIGYSRQASLSQESFRYKAVVVVRKSTVHTILDLRGKKACHTGYGRTTGWRIPLALLTKHKVIQPLCHPYQSSLEHEISSISATFNRACIPREWATVRSIDDRLKQRFKAMCSMCFDGTCDRDDLYAGYEGALSCLTEKEGDVAFTKLTVAQDFFMGNQAVNVSEFGLLCRNDKVVDILSSEAKDCFWAARPWDVHVTHGGASDAKVQKIMQALMQAKIKAEEDLQNNKWYFSTLGMEFNFGDLLPAIEKKTTKEYYADCKMNEVISTKLCTADTEKPVRFCVTSIEEHRKCSDLSLMLKLRGVSPNLECVLENSIEQCVTSINSCHSDMMTLSDRQRFTAGTQLFSLLLSENYAAKEAHRFYFVGVIKKNSDIRKFKDLVGKTTCNAVQGSNSNYVINSQMTNCLHNGSVDFFYTYKRAFNCLQSPNKDIAFVKHDTSNDGGLSQLTGTHLNPEEFSLVCENSIQPVSNFNVRECNMGRVSANLVVTRKNESDERKENMRHVLLKAVQYFGKKDSFFRLFFDYFSSTNLLFSDDTTRLVPVTDHHPVIMTMNDTCGFYQHHVSSSSEM